MGDPYFRVIGRGSIVWIAPRRAFLREARVRRYSPDNPSGDDEASVVVEDEREKAPAGGCSGVSRVPWGPRRVRLASGLWPRGIETQLNFKMICATPRRLLLSVGVAPLRSASSRSYGCDSTTTTRTTRTTRRVLQLA